MRHSPVHGILEDGSVGAQGILLAFFMKDTMIGFVMKSISQHAGERFRAFQDTKDNSFRLEPSKG